jgi:outer membrane lipoprotein LolB
LIQALYKLLPNGKTFNFWHILFALLIVSTLSGCSLFNTYKKNSALASTYYDWATTKQDIHAQTHWSLIGKIGIRTPYDSLTIAINDWTQEDDNFEINLSSTFFGLGASTLQGNSQFVTLSESGELPVRSEHPNNLMQTALGFPLPIIYLSYWVKGLPVPGLFAKIQFNEQGLPLTIRQDKWSLHLSNYHLEHGIPLPGKIKLEQNDTRIILAIKKWTLP